MKNEKFIEQATAAAIKCWKPGGSPPGVAVAQAILESNWGESQLSKKANNYFGIKAYGRQAYVVMPTTECILGVSSMVSARFAVYAGMEECFSARERLIANGRYYADARRFVNNPEAFAIALAKHWATDPDYSAKLLSIYSQRNLSQCDAECGFRIGGII